MGLAFSVTDKELYRQQLAHLAGIDLDPRGRGDAALIVIFSIVYAFGLLAVLFMLWNRNYPPLKSKNPAIMTLVMVCAWIWFGSELGANGHVPLANTAMTNCKAFGVWLRILLGVCSVSCLIALRTYGLYRVFHLNMPYQGLGFYLPFLCYFLCIIIYGIVSQLIDAAHTIAYVAVADICSYHAGFKASVFALLWVTWVLVAVLSWKIRRIKSSFNETREITLACLLVFTVLAFTTVMHYTHPRFPLDVKLRVATTALDHIAVNVLWWLIMGKPLWMCAFRRDEYLRLWMRKLRGDGLQRAYDVETNATDRRGMAELGSYGHATMLHDNDDREEGQLGTRNMGFFYNLDGAEDAGAKGSGEKKSHSSFVAMPESPVVARTVRAAHYSQSDVVLTIDEDAAAHMDSGGAGGSVGGSSSSELSGMARPASPQLVPQTHQTYRPIIFPDQAHVAPMRLTDAHARGLDPLDGDERKLI
ncbi:hypothetical protein LPJ53_001769 [Coemansia erecta]|uniref:G-protein coupled receptors family 3 profile domain-containing protein n=1 Tax=Coemansia erecta TaxID=147472 RepID=A0A9W7XZE3_9FUNG|nr:hypothetical protein LPJ53_001769 [Coemansia erecta]